MSGGPPENEGVLASWGEVPSHIPAHKLPFMSGLTFLVLFVSRQKEQRLRKTNTLVLVSTQITANKELYIKKPYAIYCP